MSSLSMHLPISTYPNRFLQAFPLVSPCLDTSGLHKDVRGLNDRMTVLFFAAISCFIASVIFPPWNIHLVLAGVSTLVIFKLDQYLTQRAWTRNSGKAFAEQKAPSRLLAERIASIPQVAQWAVSFKADLNKPDYFGHQLLCKEKWCACEIHFESFKILIENGYDILKSKCKQKESGILSYFSNCSNESVFLWSAREKNSKFLEHLLIKSLVKPSDLSAKDNAKLWESTLPRHNHQLLEKYGFKKTDAS